MSEFNPRYQTNLDASKDVERCYRVTKEAHVVLILD